MTSRQIADSAPTIRERAESQGQAKGMSAATNQAQKPAAERSNDPSMEEILASIRRIISDEQGVPLSPRPPKAESASAVPAPESLQPESRQPEPRQPEAPQVEAPRVEAQQVEAVEAPKAQADPANERRRAAARAAVESDVEFESWLRSATGKTNDGKNNDGKTNYGNAETANADTSEAPAAGGPERREGWATQVAPSVTPASGPGAIPPELEAAAQPRLAVVSPSAKQPAPDAATYFEQAARSDMPDEPVHAEADRNAGNVAGHSDPVHEDDLERPIAGGPPADQPLLSPAAGASVASSFQALTQSMFLQNSHIVENAVNEMLQPMLKQWLDDNLPVIVERLVKAEIERVARGS